MPLLNLIILDFSNNKIKILEDGLFSNLGYMNKLYLNNNLLNYIGNETFFGLDSIKEIFISKEIFLDKLNIFNLKNTFQHKIIRQVLVYRFFETININYSVQNENFKLKECLNIVLLVNFNIILNLNNDIEQFFSSCDMIFSQKLNLTNFSLLD